MSRIGGSGVMELERAMRSRVEALEATNRQLREDLDAAINSQRDLARRSIGIDPGGEHPQERLYRAVGLGVLGFVRGITKCRDKAEALGIVSKAMSEGSDSLGGFMVGPELSRMVWRNVELYGAFRRNAFKWPMGSDTTAFAKRVGGLTVYVPGEGAPITPSDVSVGLIRLICKSWLTLTAISNEADEDSAGAIGELLILEIATAFAEREDACGFVGDGTAPFFGITGVMNHADTVVLACEAADDTYAESVAWAYLTKAIGQVPTWAIPTSRYYFHRTVFWSHVVGQRDESGNPLVRFVSTVGDGLTDAPVQMGRVTPTILGFPVELVDCLPADSDETQASKYPWCFGSLYRSWVLGTRRDLQIDRSGDAYFATNQTGIRGIQRVDIKPTDATGMVRVKTGAGA
jgi:HK97 family phage major capsid protein